MSSYRFSQAFDANCLFYFCWCDFENLNNSLMLDYIYSNPVRVQFIIFLRGRNFWAFLVELCSFWKWLKCFRNSLWSQTDVTNRISVCFLSWSQHFHYFSTHYDIDYIANPSDYRISFRLCQLRVLHSNQHNVIEGRPIEENWRSVVYAKPTLVGLCSMEGTISKGVDCREAIQEF